MLFNTQDNLSFWLRVLAVVLVIAILLTGGTWVLFSTYLGQMTDEEYEASLGRDIGDSSISEDGGSEGGDLDELDVGDDDSDTVLTGDTIQAAELGNLKTLIKKWVNNGSAAFRSDVMNFLLIGMDNTDLQKMSRADAMMLLSVNTTTHKITLASLMRDQYSYVIHDGKGGFTKLHNSLRFGGPDLQIKMLEAYYKVVIDNYAIVNFETLPKVIDAMGGVTVDVTENEADFLNKECGFHIKAGENTFPGDLALVYMRIRHGNTGGDVGRTGRQRQVIMKLIDKAKSYNKAALVSMVNELIPYVRTGLSGNDILAYALTALSDGWMHYEIEQVVLPDNDCAVGFMNSEDNLWYWKVDYPLAAQKLQMALYGETNIKLDANRTSWIKKSK